MSLVASRSIEFDENILLCAKEEFLEKGYMNASLRTIALNAGVSTSAIYTRYFDKEGLFRFLVEPAAEKLKDILKDSLVEFTTLPKGEQSKRAQEYSDQGFVGFITCIYSHFNEFKLLIECSPNNMYQAFLEELVVIDIDCTKKVLLQAESQAMLEGRITDGFFHVVSSAFFSGIFEVVIHDMTLEDAKSYINELRVFYGNGWKEYFQ